MQTTIIEKSYLDRNSAGKQIESTGCQRDNGDRIYFLPYFDQVFFLGVCENSSCQITSLIKNAGSPKGPSLWKVYRNFGNC